MVYAKARPWDEVRRRADFESALLFHLIGSAQIVELCILFRLSFGIESFGIIRWHRAAGDYPLPTEALEESFQPMRKTVHNISPPVALP